MTAKHVLLLDDDMDVDGTVDCVVNDTFDKRDVYIIDHVDRGLGLDHIFVEDKNAFMGMIHEYLKGGKKIMACCGSSEEAKHSRYGPEKL